MLLLLINGLNDFDVLIEKADWRARDFFPAHNKTQNTVCKKVVIVLLRCTFSNTLQLGFLGVLLRVSVCGSDFLFVFCLSVLCFMLFFTLIVFCSVFAFDGNRDRLVFLLFFVVFA